MKGKAEEKRFQDGHEVLQHYVKGYEMPEGDEGAIEVSIESVKGDRIYRSRLVERLNTLFERTKDSRKPKAKNVSRRK